MPNLENFDRRADVLEPASSDFPSRVDVAEQLGDIAGNENLSVGRERAYSRGNVGNRAPGDPALRALCDKTQIWNKRVYAASLIIWGIGFFAAYLALPLRIWSGY